jgi:hypothetical protein
MVKKLLVFYFSFFAFHFSFSQSWEPVGGGISGGDTLHSTVDALCTYHNKLYAAGNFTIAGKRNTNSIACWDGKKWDTVGVGIKGTVYSLTVYDDKLIAGGCFQIKMGATVIKNIAQWDDHTWSNLGKGIETGSCSDVDLGAIVHSLCVYRNKLYVAGCFSKAGGLDVQDIAVWSGGNWAQVVSDKKSAHKPNQINGIDGVFSEPLCVYNDELFVGGTITKADDIDVRYLARWNELRWDSVADVFPKARHSLPTAGIYSMAVYKNELYTAGGFDTAIYGYHCIMKWNSNKWFDVGGGTNSGIFTLFVYAGKLYAGGSFTKAGKDSAKHIAAWDGSKWEAVGAGFDGIPDWPLHARRGLVTCIAEYKGDLYAGGDFTSSNGTPVLHIAKLNLGGKNLQPKKNKNG